MRHALLVGIALAVGSVAGSAAADPAPPGFLKRRFSRAVTVASAQARTRARAAAQATTRRVHRAMRTVTSREFVHSHGRILSFAAVLFAARAMTLIAENPEMSREALLERMEKELTSSGFLLAAYYFVNSEYKLRLVGKMLQERARAPGGAITHRGRYYSGATIRSALAPGYALLMLHMTVSWMDALAAVGDLSKVRESELAALDERIREKARFLAENELEIGWMESLVDSMDSDKIDYGRFFVEWLSAGVVIGGAAAFSVTPANSWAAALLLGGGAGIAAGYAGQLLDDHRLRNFDASADLAAMRASTADYLDPSMVRTAMRWVDELVFQSGAPGATPLQRELARRIGRIGKNAQAGFLAFRGQGAQALRELRASSELLRSLLMDRALVAAGEDGWFAERDRILARLYRTRREALVAAGTPGMPGFLARREVLAELGGTLPEFLHPRIDLRNFGPGQRALGHRFEQLAHGPADSLPPRPEAPPGPGAKTRALAGMLRAASSGLVATLDDPHPSPLTRHADDPELAIVLQRARRARVRAWGALEQMETLRHEEAVRVDQLVTDAWERVAGLRPELRRKGTTVAARRAILLPEGFHDLLEAHRAAYVAVIAEAHAQVRLLEEEIAATGDHLGSLDALAEAARASWQNMLLPLYLAAGEVPPGIDRDAALAAARGSAGEQEVDPGHAAAVALRAGRGPRVDDAAVPGSLPLQ